MSNSAVACAIMTLVHEAASNFRRGKTKMTVADDAVYANDSKVHAAVRVRSKADYDVRAK